MAEDYKNNFANEALGLSPNATLGLHNTNHYDMYADSPNYGGDMHMVNRADLDRVAEEASVSQERIDDTYSRDNTGFNGTSNPVRNRQGKKAKKPKKKKEAYPEKQQEEPFDTVLSQPQETNADSEQFQALTAQDAVNTDNGSSLNDEVRHGSGHARLEDKQEETGVALRQETALSRYDRLNDRTILASLYDELLKLYEFQHDENMIFYYDQGCWKGIRKNDELRGLRKIIPEGYRFCVNKRTLDELYEWIIIGSKERIYIKEKERYRYVNFSDCAVDCITGQVLSDEQRKNMGFEYVLAIPYDTQSSSGMVEQYLQSVFGDDKKTLREFKKCFALGVGDARDLKVAIIFNGGPNTGKTVALNYLRLVVGEEYCSSVSFSQMDKEFAVAQLLGKRLNLSAEISGTSNTKLDIFKSLTGNDSITTSFKYKDHFQFRNQAMLFFACNVFPAINNVGEVESLMKRFIIFPFEKSFERGKWIDHLEQKMYQDIGGTIQLISDGIKALHEDGGILCETKAMRMAKRCYREEYDSFGVFAADMLKPLAGNKITSRQLNEYYQKYCRDMGLNCISQQQWSPLLTQRFPNVKRNYMTDDNGNKVRGYEGIAYQNEIDDEELPTVQAKYKKDYNDGDY